jgi:hypothetical protein
MKPTMTHAAREEFANGCPRTRSCHRAKTPVGDITPNVSAIRLGNILGEAYGNKIK